jgi:outer membrane immunogenic protein
MKKAIIAAITILLREIAVDGAASAADIPIKSMPPVIRLYNWTGFYVGAQIGALWSGGDSRWDPSFGANTITQNLKDNSFAGGFQAGYNYTFAPNWVAGVEADWSWTNNKSSGTTNWTLLGTSTPTPGFTILSRKIDWLSTVRGRVGYTVTPQILLYATGGFAFANIKYDAIASNTFNYSPTASLNAVKTGYSLGGGLEYALSNNWLLRGEYLFYRLGSESTIAIDARLPTFPAGFTWESVNVHNARLALSYKFGN